MRESFQAIYASCDVSLLRSASSDTGLPVNESSNAHVMQPSSGPMGQWSGCNMGLTGFARGDNYNPSCVPTRLGNPELATAFGRGQKVSTEGSGDMGVDVPMSDHGSSPPQIEQAELSVRPDDGAGLDGPATSDFACASTKARGGGELPGLSKVAWIDMVEEEEQGGQFQKGSGYLQALHAATMGDKVHEGSGQRMAAYHAL